jgi:fused signal recognition particle receptor
MSWLQKLKQGLSKTSNKISESLVTVFVKKKLDQETLDELEELLISSDLGVHTSHHIITKLAKHKFNQEVTIDEIKSDLAQILIEILQPANKPINITTKPHVILVCGVNGNGKTTTIGKLAAKFAKDGHRITMAACDTFRAAAIGQLKVWADRVKAEFISGPENSDPASIAFKAIDAAKENNSDIVLIDTAGRLHNKTNLMEELSKIVRIIKKQDQDAPHETILVIDATTGQNAISQLETFHKFINITGIIITKLDGTAKAGIVVSLVQKFKIPIYAIGVGEHLDDLNEFNPEDFSRGLLGL